MSRGTLFRAAAPKPRTARESPPIRPDEVAHLRAGQRRVAAGDELVPEATFAPASLHGNGTGETFGGTSGWSAPALAAAAGRRDDLDDLLTCFRYKDPDQRRQVRTTNAIERREVRRRIRPMGAFQDRTSMDRILFAIFIHENKPQGSSTL